VSHFNRTARLEQEHEKRNPPKLVPLARFLQDGERVTRLYDRAPAQLSVNAPRVIREVVDPSPPEGDDANMPPPTVVFVDGDGAAHSAMPDPQPAEHALPEEQPELPDDAPAPRPKRRESFERRTAEWNAQLGQGLGRPTKKRRGIDCAPNERDEFKKAAKQRRVDVIKPRRKPL
jgi:hypothetical protein